MKEIGNNQGGAWKRLFSGAFFVAVMLAASAPVYAGLVTVYLDDGTQAPGTSNTSRPYTVGGRDSSWDVSATAENGLADIGAAVMSVRMLTFAYPQAAPANGISRTASNGFGFGLAVTGLGNDRWMDGGEAAAFKLTFYSDAAKTTEITGLNITFDSLIARMADSLGMDVFAGSGALALTDPSDAGFVTLGGTNMTIANDDAISFSSEKGLVPASFTGTGFYTVSGTGAVSFGENDVFWVRRPGDANKAYQLGGITFDVQRISGYASWAGGWGVDIGASTNDFDGDGLNNLYEYGLGGDPTNPANQGTSPEFGIMDIGGTNYFGYVHPQLHDPDSGLDYYLELSTDLVSGIWTNTGYAVTGTNVTGGQLDFVTNVADTVDGQKFIRLVIE